MPEFVFLYGSLMRGFEMHEALDIPAVAEFMGGAQCRGMMYDLGDYPGVTFEGTGRVQGELYRVHDEDAIGMIDRHEGYRPETREGSTYVRRLEEMVNRSMKAWVYVYNGRTNGHEVIDSGSWREHLGRR